ncbi:MAG: extracellular solute-binding protein [Clostridia bacterium]|nr:extracellular solute-binding protein [Clostridia bacterium]
MKKMFKAVALMLALVLTVSMLAGCGVNKSDKNDKGQTVITVGGWPAKEGTELDNMNKRKADFDAANPDIEIVPDLWKFDRKTFYAKAAGGQLPGVYQAGYTEISEIINSELSADLTDVVKERGIYDMMNPTVREALERNGKLYALPKSAAVLGLTYNTELFQAAGLMEADGTPKAPATWDELVEVAKLIKEKTGKPGFVLPTSKHGGWFFTILGWSFGVEFMHKDENGKWIATFDSPEAVAAMQWIKDLRWEHDVVPPNSLVDGEQWWEIFGAGNAAMTFGAPSMVTTSVVKRGMTPMQFGMIPMPAGPARNVTQITGEVWCINPNATADQIEAGIRWLETSVNFNATEEFKTTKELEIENYKEINRQIGAKEINMWKSDSEAYKFEHALIDANCNTNPNFVRLYNEYVADCPAEIQAEEPINCQELYETLGACIQELFANKDADCAELLKKANADFQSNYLDNTDY